MLVEAMNATLDSGEDMNEKKAKQDYIEHMKKANGVMRNITLEQEIILVEKTENIVNEFESRYGDLRAASADLMEHYFRDAENAENVYFEQVLCLYIYIYYSFGFDSQWSSFVYLCYSLFKFFFLFVCKVVVVPDSLSLFSLLSSFSPLSPFSPFSPLSLLSSLSHTTTTHQHAPPTTTGINSH